jgi:1,4-dihydroxy-2-naphthoyl-CoA synthase
MEDRNQVLTVANGDLAEGMRAFLQKRKPDYSARSDSMNKQPEQSA